MKWPLFLQLAHDDEERSSPKQYAMPEDLIPVLKVGIGRKRILPETAILIFYVL